MIRNYFLVALRNLKRNRMFAFINITGLVLGLTVVIVLFWIIRFELGFDMQYTHSKDLYQVFSIDRFDARGAHIPSGVLRVLRESPEVERAAMVYGIGTEVMSIDGELTKTSHVFFADNDISKMIDLEWAAGNPRAALNEPFSIAVSESVAASLLHNDAMGKTIRIKGHDMKVTGVIKDPPGNSNFQFKVLISGASLPRVYSWLRDEDYWSGGDSGNQAYVQLAPGASHTDVSKRINDALKPHQPGVEYSSFVLRPLSESHFDASNDPFNYYTPKWMVGVLTAIGAFLVIIASINFINLSTVQSALRGREIAMRRILGGRRLELIAQFLIETAVVVTISVGLSSFLASWLILYTDQLLTTQVAADFHFDSESVLFVLALTGMMVLLAGMYPAFVMSGLAPIRILRNKFSALSSGGSGIRKGLVVVQFAIAQVLVICMLVGIQQVKNFTERDPGFARDAVISVTMPEEGKSGKGVQRMREQLANKEGIGEITFGLTAPATRTNTWWGSIQNPKFEKGEAPFRLQWTDANYFEFFRIPVVAGRTFNDQDTIKDIHRVIINARAVAAMGLKDPEEAIGSVVKSDNISYEVVGVVADYFSEGLKYEIVPHIYFFKPNNFQSAMIKVDGNRWQQAIETTQEIWTREFPNTYFEYTSLDQTLDTFYEDDRKFSSFVNLFAIVAVSIACLGLYGMVSSYCVRRTQEVGIRKVLGASIADITTILSGHFIKLILISFLFAIPVGWWLMREFLSQYAYAIDISWTTFVMAGVGSVLVALMPIGYHALKSALVNPADSLRSE